jgi:hypothetical protein
MSPIEIKTSSLFYKAFNGRKGRPGASVGDLTKNFFKYTAFGSLVLAAYIFASFVLGLMITLLWGYTETTPQQDAYIIFPMGMVVLSLGLSLFFHIRTFYKRLTVVQG